MGISVSKIEVNKPADACDCRDCEDSEFRCTSSDPCANCYGCDEAEEARKDEEFEAKMLSGTFYGGSL